MTRLTEGKDPARAFAAPTHPKRRSDIRFRAMDDADLPFLAGLYVSSRERELASVPWPEQAKTAFLKEQFGLQHDHYQRHYPGADFWLIERAAEPIGRIYVHRGQHEIRLMDVILLPNHQGQGLGTSLIAELVDEADRLQLPITLHVEGDNPVKRLYQRLGFTLVEQRGPYEFHSRTPNASI